jgi:hypothetical protein
MSFVPITRKVFLYLNFGIYIVQGLPVDALYSEFLIHLLVQGWTNSTYKDFNSTYRDYNRIQRNSNSTRIDHTQSLQEYEQELQLYGLQR